MALGRLNCHNLAIKQEKTSASYTATVKSASHFVTQKLLVMRHMKKSANKKKIS